MALAYFGESSILKGRINTDYYNPDDILKLIKYLKLEHACNHKEKIYYNASWEEILNKTDYTYYGIVDSIDVSIFYISYYTKDSIKVRDGKYYTVYPLKRHGESHEYFPNGNLRKTTLYRSNIAKETTLFYRNGEIRHRYRINDTSDYFYEIFDIEGYSVLDDNGNGEYNYFDSITQKSLHYSIKDHRLFSIYYHNSNNEKIFRYCEKNAKLKNKDDIKGLLKELNYPEKSLSNFHHGLFLIKCVVNENGDLVDIDILKSLDDYSRNTELKIIGFLKSKAYWKAGKSEKNKVKQEFIIPVYFHINFYYATSYIQDLMRNANQINNMNMHRQNMNYIPNNIYK